MSQLYSHLRLTPTITPSFLNRLPPLSSRRVKWLALSRGRIACVTKTPYRIPFPNSTGHQYTSNQHASRSSNSFRTQWLISLDNPTNKVRRHTTDKPWVTDHFRYLINWRQYAYMSGNTTLFRSLRNIVIREAKIIRATYYHQRIQLLRNCDPCRWWKHTKAITGLGKTTNEFVAMANALCDGKMSSLAEEINLFFESVHSELNPLDMGTLPTYCRVPVTYIINTDTVTKLLNAIKINKAIGPDDIPNWILRDHAINLAPPICAIFNDSIREGYIPASGNVPPLSPFQKLPPLVR